jgi:hypothetical protein
MYKEFITYEQALELKELGFDEICVSFFTPEGDLYQSEGYYKYGKNVFGDEVIAPLYQQVFRWFRKKYELYADIFVDDDKTFGFCVSSFTDEDKCRLDKPIKRQFNTYEDAESECINFLIEIIERKPEAYN